MSYASTDMFSPQSDNSPLPDFGSPGHEMRKAQEQPMEKRLEPTQSNGGRVNEAEDDGESCSPGGHKGEEEVEGGGMDTACVTGGDDVRYKRKRTDSEMTVGREEEGEPKTKHARVDENEEQQKVKHVMIEEVEEEEEQRTKHAGIEEDESSCDNTSVGAKEARNSGHVSGMELVKLDVWTR